MFLRLTYLQYWVLSRVMRAQEMQEYASGPPSTTSTTVSPLDNMFLGCRCPGIGAFFWRSGGQASGSMSSANLRRLRFGGFGLLGAFRGFRDYGVLQGILRVYEGKMLGNMIGFIGFIGLWASKKRQQAQQIAFSPKTKPSPRLGLLRAVLTYTNSLVGFWSQAQIERLCFVEPSTSE